MAPSIGGYTMITIKGVPTPPATMVAEITRPNVDGHAYVAQGSRAPVELLSSRVDLVSAAAAGNEIVAYRALCSTLVTYVDDVGNTWTNVMVLSVRASYKYVATPVGGVNGGNYLVSAQWQVQHTGIT